MKLFTVKLFLGIAIAFTCLAFFLSYVNYNHYEKCATDLKETNALVLKTTELLSLMKDAETGQRGYLLTSDTLFLEPFQEYIKKIDQEKAEMKLLIKENPHLKSDLELITWLISKKERFMKHTIQVNDSLGTEASMTLIRSHRGKILMDSIRMAVTQMLEKEKYLLTETSVAYDEELLVMNTVSYIFQVFVVGVCALAFFMLSRQQTQNNELIIGLQEAKDTLEKKVRSRTMDLFSINQEITAQNEEIQSQTEQITTQNEELVRVNKEKNHFIGVVTHDLKSPLNRVKGLINIIQASPNAAVASQKEYFDMILNTLAGTQKLIGDLLDINRIEEGRNDLQWEEFDLVPYLEKSLSVFEEMAKEKGIRLRFASNIRHVAVTSDKTVLWQVLENLLSNALKFSQRDTEVILQVNLDLDRIKVAVIDQGPGISPDEVGLLFGKFQKLSNKPTGGESSTGLGLSIVKDLVKQLGGKIYCESVQGKGSAFVVELYK